jgi:long-chain acyl-CoA synthetase
VNQIDMPAIVKADPQANTTDILIERVKLSPDAPLFSLPVDAEWVDVTAREFLDQVIALAKGFVASGIQPGDRIGLMSKTRYEWTLIDFAAWFAGAVLVPIYETSAPAQVHWNLVDSGAVGVVLETPDHFARFDEVHPDLPLIRAVWQIDLGDLGKLVELGSSVPDDEIEKRRRAAVGSDMATLIYTSGSTGKPKGCVLTHSNFVELARNSAASLPEIVQPGAASTLLFITIAHVFARFITVLCIHAGVKVGHQADATQLLGSMATFKPTFLLAVPRVFEKVYNSAQQKAEAAGRDRIFNHAVTIAIAHSKALQAGYVPFALKLRFAVFNLLVFSKIRAAMGGRVAYAVSGSAPLSIHLGHFFHSLGIVILEGYGLTETTAPSTVNLVPTFRIGTVGQPLPGVSIRIADDGEVEVKGINVLSGYWHNEAATALSLRDGWFATGDLGSLSDDGFLTITGRKKDIIVTAGGKNVAPTCLEDPIRANPLVSQVVVIGDAQPFISALITLDTEMLPMWLAHNGQTSPLSPEVAATNPVVRAEIQRAIDGANNAVSRAESIRKFVILTNDLTEASGHLTPKLSLKRDVILRDYAAVIESIYTVEPADRGPSLVL